MAPGAPRLPGVLSLPNLIMPDIHAWQEYWQKPCQTSRQSDLSQIRQPMPPPRHDIDCPGVLDQWAVKKKFDKENPDADGSDACNEVEKEFDKENPDAVLYDACNDDAATEASGSTCPPGPLH